MTPKGWKKQPVGMLCRSVVPGRNKPKTFTGDIPWVTTPEVYGRYIPSIKQQHFTSIEDLKNCGGKLIPPGSVVMSCVGELGLVAIANREVALNQQLHAFICSEEINNEYLAYWLEQQKPYMQSIASKTTIPYMNKTNCESIPVLYPQIEEQTKIAQILSTWDKAIEITEKLIENSKAHKNALMQQLLSGQLRLPGCTNKWSEYRLKDITTILVSNVDKKTHGSEQPVSLCNYTDVYYNTYITNDFPFMVATATEREITKFKLRKGDVLITKDSESPDDIAISALVRENLTDVLCGYHLAIIRPKPKLADGGFLNYLFSLKYVRRYFSTLANGATRFGLSIGSIENATFKLPILSDQKKIASILMTQDDEIENLTSQRTFLVQQKLALMQQLLTGKRRVKVSKVKATKAVA